MKHKRRHHRMEHRKVVKTLPDRTAPAVIHVTAALGIHADP